MHALKEFARGARGEILLERQNRLPVSPPAAVIA